jgi:ubiquinone/menaquinone biosynthesis C-methylase UbiE
VRIDRLIFCVLAFAGAVASIGCNGLSKLDLTTLGRASWQRPEEVVRALKLRPGDRVADIGAGEGYFLPYLSEAVGSRGRVFAVEVEPELAQSLEAELPDGGNVEVVLGRYEDPELPDRSIDLVLIVNTYHHIEDRPAYFTRLMRDLSPSGRVAIIEPDAELHGVLGLFVAEGHHSSVSGIAEEMGAAGYRPSASHDFLAVQVFEVFAPKDDAG